MSDTLINTRQLLSLVQSGLTPVIEDNEKFIGNNDIDLDPGMRVRVIRVAEEGDGVLRITSDFKEFWSINVHKQVANYYGENSGPNVTWDQTN